MFLSVVVPWLGSTQLHVRCQAERSSAPPPLCNMFSPPFLGVFPWTYIVPRFRVSHLIVAFGAPATPGTSGTTDRLARCHRFSRIVRILAIVDAVVVLCGASAFT